MRIKSKIKDYNVIFFDSVSDLMSKVDKTNTLWIIDDNVHNYWSKEVNFESLEYFTLHCNEDLKSFENVYLLIDKFAHYKVNNNTTIITVGGGTLQDAVGFACSIYHRGINWKFIPTTLLSMADSCIGGKTSINYRDRKNIIGTFYPPSEILLCEEWLETLPKLYYNSGMGEIIKFYILNNDIFLISENKHDIIGHIKYSLEYKNSIIEKDEFDKNERKFLNYGHTFGHALEATSLYEIPHGIAVLIGILIVNRYAKKLNMISDPKEKEIISIILPYLSNIRLDKEWFDFDKTHNKIKSDKKNTNSINLVLILNNFPVLLPVSNILLLQESLEEIYQLIK